MIVSTKWNDMKKFFCALFSLLISTASAAEYFKTDPQGFIRHWVMLAPIALPAEGSGADLIVQEQLKNEAALKPTDGERVQINSQNFVWMNVSTRTNFIDFNLILNSSENDRKVGFMVAYVECENEMASVTLAAACNDQGRVYLNGKEILVHTAGGALEVDSDKQKVTLSKGLNVIVFKVINEANNWQAALRFLDSAGAPIKSLRIKLSP